MLDCPDGWQEFDDRCYFISKPEVKESAEMSMKICENNGGKLAVANTMSEWVRVFFEL